MRPTVQLKSSCTVALVQRFLAAVSVSANMSVIYVWQTGSSDRSLENLTTQPEVRRALAKVHLKDSWAQSLIESHADSEARTSMLATFWKEVEFLQQRCKILGLDGIEVSKLKHAPVQWF